MDKTEVLNKLYERLTALEEDEGITPVYRWEWEQGVGLFSIYKLYEATGDKRCLEFLNGWYGKMLGKGFDKNINTMSPLLALTYLYEAEKNTGYLEVIKENAEWLMNKMPRTVEGGMQHLTTHTINNDQLWADTLFMTILFLARAGKVLNNQKMQDEAVYQTIIHIKYLSDCESGLWYHGWSLTERHFGGIFWGRGNCWITIAIPEILTIVEEISMTDRRLLEEAYKRQVGALIKYQDISGMWRTIINDEDSYFETSATAGFAYGILTGVKYGAIDKSHYLNSYMAVRYIVSNYLGEDGSLKQVSAGTAMGYDSEHYKNIGFCQTPYGQGLMILAVLALEDTEKFYN